MVNKENVAGAGKIPSGPIMYVKGRKLIEGSRILRVCYGKNTFVQLYLLLQGIEVIFKAILLLEKPEQYNLEKIKKKYNHRILDLVKVVKEMYRVENLNMEFYTSLEKLTKAGGSWINLRYGGLIDIFHSADSYETRLVYKKVDQIMLFVEKRHKSKIETFEYFY